MFFNNLFILDSSFSILNNSFDTKIKNFRLDETYIYIYVCVCVCVTYKLELFLVL